MLSMSILHPINKWAWIPLAIICGFIPCEVSRDLLTVLYTIIGIAFGIGFSLIISSVYREVKNPVFRKRLRQNLSSTRSRFVRYFLISTCLYILHFFLNKKMFISLGEYFSHCQCLYDRWLWTVNHYHFRLTVLMVLLVTLAVYVKNYNSLQKVNEELDEELV